MRANILPRFRSSADAKSFLRLHSFGDKLTGRCYDLVGISSHLDRRENIENSNSVDAFVHVDMAPNFLVREIRCCS